MSFNRRHVFTVLLLASLGLASASQVALAQDRNDLADTLLIDWTGPEGQKWTFRARIDRPARQSDRGRAVFMFGGGFSNDIDWTTPGRFEHEGNRMQVTISGEDARDGQTLAAALVADGWTVIRYSSIREGDPLRARSLAMAEAMPYPGTLELARFMWKELLAKANFEPDRVIALGHSLGATRALHVTDGRAAGYVFLAGAYLSPTRASPRKLEAESLAAFASAEDSELSAAEAAQAKLPGSFEEIDRDKSGALRGWEVAAAQRLAGGVKPESATFDSGGALPWPSDLLSGTKPPVLAIWGGLDAISYHGPLLEDVARRQSIPVTTHYFARLGHNLGAIEGDRTGPIEVAVVEAVTGWLDKSFPREKP